LTQDEKDKLHALQKLALVRKFAYQDSHICCVLPGLFLGGIGAARNLSGLQEQGVTHVLNMSPVVPCFHRKALRYKTVTVFDDPDSNIAQFFPDTNKYIHKGRRRGGVLVHCYAGKSRSTTIVLAYMMACERMDLDAALSHVKQARPVAQPNTGFMQQLYTYRASLQEQNPVETVESGSASDSSTASEPGSP
jgi:protein-tyrosine phosphatase